MSTSSSQQTTTGPFDSTKKLVSNPPSAPPAVSALVEWIIAIFLAIMNMIEQIGRANDHRLSELEEITDSHATVLEERSTVSAATAAPPTVIPDTPTSRRLPSRCSLCHARGHTDTQCRTTNPSAMRKRVDRNNRIAKEARQASRIPIPAPPPFFYPQYPHITASATTPMNYAAMAADATELRQRAAQSARDKRHKRPTTTS